jgi:N-acetylneuraminic acid mutarotase
MLRSRLAAAALVLAALHHPVHAQQAPERSLPEVNGWSLAAPMIAPSSEQAIAEAGGKLYSVGGYPPGRIPVDLVQVYDPAANRWSAGPPLPVPMHHTVAAGVGGKLYVLGGEFDGAGTGRREVYLDSTYELDPATNTWAQKASMPTGRSAGGAAVIGSKIYVAGGRPPHGSDFAVYDTATDTWEVLPPLPTGRNHLAVGAIGGKVYVAGGRFGGGFMSERTAALEFFDPATREWSIGPSMPSPRGGVAAVVANGCLFVVGGEGEYADYRGLSDQNEAFDPRSGTWHSLPPMPTPSHGLVGAAFIDGRIHLPGGSITIGGGTGTVIHQRYRPTITCE